MRQFLAATMIFGALPLIIRKKYILSLFIVLAAMTVHKGALLMIPVLIIAHSRPWSKLMILSMVLFAVVLYFYIGHSDWMSDEELQAAQGSNPLRIAISSIPVILAFIGRKKIAEANNRLINLCINISVSLLV